MIALCPLGLTLEAPGPQEGWVGQWVLSSKQRVQLVGQRGSGGLQQGRSMCTDTQSFWKPRSGSQLTHTDRLVTHIAVNALKPLSGDLPGWFQPRSIFRMSVLNSLSHVWLREKGSASGISSLGGPEEH